ncbi:MAG: GxxExxY protein [Salinivirgaceae bacterium]
MPLKHKELSEQLIRTFFDVFNELGYGFLEKVYQNTMYVELKSRGYFVEGHKQLKVYYKNVEVGEYYPDLIVDNKIIIELKAAEYLVPENEAQLINYLKATDIEVGLLFNFGKKPEFKRKIFETARRINKK